MKSFLKRALDTLRTSFALGADKGLHILTKSEIDKDLQPIHVATILRDLIEKRGFDFIIMGKQAIDDDYNQTGQILSSFLNWPQISFISKLDYQEELKKFLIEREIDGGIQTLYSPINSVFTCDLRLNKPRQAKLNDIMKSKNKPLETLKIEDFDLSKIKALKIKEVNEPEKRKGGVIVKDVDELIQKLKTEARVI